MFLSSVLFQKLIPSPQVTGSGRVTALHRRKWKLLASGHAVPKCGTGVEAGAACLQTPVPKRPRSGFLGFSFLADKIE